MESPNIRIMAVRAGRRFPYIEEYGRNLFLETESSMDLSAALDPHTLGYIHHVNN